MLRSAHELVPVLAVLLFATLVGCSSPTQVLIPVYDACLTVDDCVATATLCEELRVEFGGFDYVNSVCTLHCEAEGPLSDDCPRAYVGLFGSCYPSSLAGGVDDALICFDPCFVDDDCQLGFRCLGADGLCGSGLGTCPIDQNDAICVPGPE